MWRVCPGGSLEGEPTLRRRATDAIVAAVESVKGPRAAETLRSAGLAMLHTVIEPLDIGPIRDCVLDTLRPDLLEMAVRIGRSVMGWTDEFYVDDYLILRINLPYEVARAADGRAENPGIGRVSASVRDLAASRRVKDPVYAPASYHGGHPPAAWAHGPHVDSWSGHSKDGLNVWWALVDVPADAGMVLYPGLGGDTLSPDPRTLYLQSGYALPAPTFVPLAAGDMLVFDPEILHGTHLNVTARTRVAISMRLNAAEPAFDPGCFYAREFWRRASGIEGAAPDEVLHLKREEHLAASAPAPVRTPRAAAPVIRVHAAAGSPFAAVGPSSLVPEGGRIVAESSERRILMTRVDGQLYAVDAACAHHDIDLSDGGLNGTTIHCPGCAVGFDIVTGRSASPSLMLRAFEVREDGGTIVVAVG